ncbi:Crp/Fnr family transcriptional regulator [Novosphingobium fluoreni]|uniref:Crp/Fnr family transcriptional regulator n=1 Tax=Novosphingobium fluoreni TaxID=1391222 RepID=UPI003DA16E90
MPKSVTHTQDRQFRRYEHIARAGDRRDCIYRVVHGWACRYEILYDGRRQIAALYLPGEYCEPHWLLSGRAERPVMALTRLNAIPILLSDIHRLRDEGVKDVLGAMVKTLERQTRLIVCLGRKNAIERIEELFADLRNRLGSDDERIEIPLTQREIADIVGLTPVHVNRVLHRLAEQKRVFQQGRTLLATAEHGAFHY